MYVHYFHSRIVLQIFAELGYVNVHAAAIEVGIAAPYPLQCGFARQQIVLVFAKHQERVIPKLFIQVQSD